MGTSTVCRLCMKKLSVSVYIFSANIPSIIECLTSIKVDKNDGLPSISCQTCIADLFSAYEMRNRIINSDKSFRNGMLNGSSFSEIITKENSNISYTEPSNDNQNQPTDTDTLLVTDYNDCIDQLPQEYEIKQDVSFFSDNSQEVISEHQEPNEVDTQPNLEIVCGTDEIEEQLEPDSEGVSKIFTNISSEYNCDTDVLQTEFEDCNEQSGELFRTIKDEVSIEHHELLNSELDDAANLETNMDCDETENVSVCGSGKVKTDNSDNDRQLGDDQFVNSDFASSSIDGNQPINDPQKEPYNSEYIDDCIYLNGDDNNLFNEGDNINDDLNHTPISQPQTKNTQISKPADSSTGDVIIIDDDSNDGLSSHVTSSFDQPKPRVSLATSTSHDDSLSKEYDIITLSSDVLERKGDKVFCKICHIEVNRYRAYIHRNKHMKAKCKICSIVVRADNVRKHVLCHKSGPQICDICGSTHKSIEGLRSHLFNFHTKRKFYKCEFCDQEFRISGKLWDHKRRVHTGERPYVCEQCGKAFFSSFTLKKHKNLVHLNLRAFKCEYCERGYSSPHALKTHRRQHTGELPYVCEHCCEGFRQMVSLRTHMKSKHNIIMKANKPGHTYSQQAKQEKERLEREKETEENKKDNS